MIPPVKLRNIDYSPHQLVFVNLILTYEMGINFICCYFNLSCIFTRVVKAFKCITANILTAIYKPWKASFYLLKQWPSPSRLKAVVETFKAGGGEHRNTLWYCHPVMLLKDCQILTWKEASKNKMQEKSSEWWLALLTLFMGCIPAARVSWCQEGFIPKRIKIS